MFQFSWVSSLLPLSAVFAAICGGFLIELLGRKWTTLITNILFTVSWVIVAIANAAWFLYLARVILGFAVSVTNLVLPVYLGETIHEEIRGTLTLLPTVFGNGGVLLCFTCGGYIRWKGLAWVGLGISLPFAVMWYILPESPRWFLSKNKPEKSQKALQRLRGKNTNIEEEFKELETAHEASKQTVTHVKDLFVKHNYKPLLICIALMFFQQMCGINAVVFYATPIFHMANSTVDERLCTIIIGLVNFISTFVATAVVDKVGRKLLLYISAGTMILTLIVLGVYFYYKNLNYDVNAYGWAPLASLVVYVFTFSLGFGPIPWLLMGELLPAKIRGFAAAIVTSFNWLCAFIVTKTFPNIIDLIGAHFAFWIYAVITILAIPFVIFMVPETKGKTLEEIESEFD